MAGKRTQRREAPEPPAQGNLGEYAVFLSQRRDRSTGLRRSERTRLSLMIGAARALNTQGLRQATVESIVQAAGLSHSTFYLHFTSKNAIASVVLLAFLDDMEATGRQGPKPTSDYDRAYLATLHYISAFRANPGLARCLLQLDDEHDEVLAEVKARVGSAWYSRSTQFFLRHFPTLQANEQQLMFAVSAMGGMVDDLLRRLVVHQHADVVRLVDEVAASDEDLAEALTCLWWRAIVGEPPEARSALTRALSAGVGARVE